MYNTTSLSDIKIPGESGQFQMTESQNGLGLKGP